MVYLWKIEQYVAAGGIRPRAVLPVVLDVGTNNEELLNDPLYLGMPHRRLDGEEYYSFVDEWVTAVKSRWPSMSLYHFALHNWFLTSCYRCFDPI